MVVEVQVINYALDHGIKGLKPELFSKCYDQFMFIKDFYEKYHKLPDKVTFLDKFPGFKLFEVSDPLESLLPRLREEVFATKLIPIYNKCADIISEGDSLRAASLIEGQIAKLRKELSDDVSESVDITDYDYKMSEFKKLKENLVVMSTGFPEMDALLGGWSNEDLVVIFARLGVGKSWIAIRYAYELVKQGKRVGFYAGEMSPDKLSLRMDSFGTGTSNFLLQMGKMTEADYSTVAKQISDLPGKMFVLTPRVLGRSATVEDIKRFIEKDRLDCVFIDQISLMHRDGRKSIHDAIASIANDLRVLQSVSQIPMFIVSQQNRASLQDSEVGAEHIAQSDDIGQNATIAIALEYNKETRVLTQNIVKSRNSSTAKFSYLWDIDRGRMTFIPGEEAVVETTDQTQYNDLSGRPF